MTIEFDAQEIQDLEDCAAERGVAVQEMIRQAVLDDLAR